jgi:hypothetical protein
MAITTAEARQKILDDLGIATAGLESAVAAIGEAYELLDVTTADRLEDELFRPLQKAYGRAKRTRSGFADRVGVVAAEPESPGSTRSHDGVKGYVERAAAAAGEADHRLAELQDSMLPIESGDAELRAGLGEVRELLGGMPQATLGFLRTLGR